MNSRREQVTAQPGLGKSVFFVWVILLAAAGYTLAGGPRAVNGLGQPMRWNPAGTIVYHPDRGSLGTLSKGPARTLLSQSFVAWTSAVPITAGEGSQLPVDVNASGNPSTNAAHFQNFYRVAGDGLSPIIFDTDGSIIDALLGEGARFDVLGLAGLDTPIGAVTQITEASIIINGAFYDGIGPPASPPDITLTGLKAAMVHEIGHFLNLDHTVLNHEQALDDNAGNDIYVPTMFPVAVLDDEALASLNPDDTLAATNLYSMAPLTFQMSGSLSFGGLPFQGANVVFRDQSSPLMNAYSLISGGLYFPCNPASVCDPCNTACDPGHPPEEGAFSAAYFGPGQFRVCVEPIDTRFSALGGAGVGPLAIPPLLPGPEECFDLSEGGTGADDPDNAAQINSNSAPFLGIVLNALPVSDLFEPNDSLGSGATLDDLESGQDSQDTAGATIDTGDLDVFNVPVTAGQRVRIDIDAKELGSGLDAVVGFFNASNTLVASSDDSVDPDSGVFSLDPSLEVIATFTGTAKVVVSSYPDTSFTGSNGSTFGPYWIRVEVDSDADGDGVPDGEDICPATARDDADRDSFCFGADTCPTQANLNQTVPVKYNAAMPAGSDVASFAVSPNGAWVIYLADQDTPGTQELYRAPIAGGPTVKLNGTLVSGGAVSSFAISPDSQTVVYRASQDEAAKIELYAAPIGGGPVTKLNSFFAPGGNVEDFRISPNSGRVVFRLDAQGDDALDLVSVAMAGGAAVVLSEAIVGRDTVAYDFSSNMSRVVYIADENGAGNFELFSILPGGGSKVKLNPTVGGSDVLTFQISPNSINVIYLGDYNTSDVPELYTVPLTGGSSVMLNTPLGSSRAVTSFAVTGNSARVVYRADQNADEEYGLFSVSAGGGAVTNLLSGMVLPPGGDVAGYEITPDSLWVVFLVDSPLGVSSLEARSVPTVGGSQTPLWLPSHNGTGNGITFAISPDNTRVVFRVDLGVDESFELYSFTLGGVAAPLSGALPAGADVSYFGIAPDSTRVAYLADQDLDGRVEIYSAPIGGGGPVRLNGLMTTGGQVADEQAALAFSPNSTRVIYRANQQIADSFELYSVDAAFGGDLDVDGILNACDVCPVNYDPLQDDADGNGLGDTCAICSPGTDPDADLVCGAADNCPVDANNDLADLDLDGAGDACDADDDNDGLSDAVETDTGIFVDENDTGSDPLDSDSDNDGILDGEEVAAGTDPNNPAQGPPVVPFTGRTISTLAHGVVAVAATDLDGDGDLDPLVALPTIPEIAWYQNNGGSPPSYTKRTLLASPISVSSLAAADLDRDGDQDIVAAMPSLGALLWYESDGGAIPNFLEREINPGADQPGAVAVGDIDGDGDPDVLTGGLGVIEWYENDLPTWTQRFIEISEGVAPHSVHLADLDGDGDLDGLSGRPMGSGVYWHENLGGTPPVWLTHDISPGSFGVAAVTTADLDGDGDLEVLSARQGDFAIDWHDKDGSLPTGWTRRDIATSVFNPYSVVAADVDADGDLDAVSASDGDHTVAWYENDGTPVSGWTKHVLTSTAFGARSACAGDLDGDGDTDILAGSAGDSKLLSFENRTPHRSADFPAATDVATGLLNPYGLDFADIDRDGALDIVSVSANDHKLSWHKNNGASPWTTYTFATVRVAEMVVAADIDRDGDPDAVTISYDDDEVVWYQNTGNPMIWSQFLLPNTGIGPSSVAVADLNSDGLLDVIVTYYHDNRVTWYRNGGGFPPTWTEHAITTTAPFKRGLATADLDEDGDIDVMSALPSSGLIAWYENPGGDPTSVWATHNMDPAGVSTPNRVAAGDIDGDGDIDVAATAYAGVPEIVWFENTPALTFPRHSIPVGQTGNFGISIVDLDGDGDNDLVSTSVAQIDTISWWENDGAQPPGWTQHAIYYDPNNANAPQVAEAADLDRDGDLDLVAGMGLGTLFRKISLYENRGGQFSLTPTSLAPATVANGATVPLFSLLAKSNGRAGEDSIELASLELQITDGGGLALSSDEANALFARIRIYLDNGSGVFELGSDTLVQTIEDLVLAPLTVSFIPDDTRIRLAPGQSRRYFVVAVMTSDASSRTPNTFRITLPATTQARVLQSGKLLDPAWAASVATPIISTATDLAAPFVTGVFPANARIDVSASTDVVVYFSEPIDPATAGQGVALSLAGIKVDAETSVSPDRRAVSLNPNGSLALGQSFVLQVSPTLKDPAGVAALPFTSTFTTTSDPASGQIDAGSLGDTSGGRTVQGANADDGSGFATAALRDVNAASGGIDDLIIGAPNADAGAIDAGKATLVFGAVELQSNLEAVTSLVYQTGTAGDFIGETVSRAGDVNGDGIHDFLIGAPRSDQAGANAGVVYLVFGNAGLDEAAPGPLDLDNLAACGLPTLCGVRFLGQAAGDLAGAAISYAGDVDADGFGDILIGAPGADPPGKADAGKVYLIFGPLGPGTVSLATVGSTTRGLVFQGESAGDRAGAAVSSWEDLHGDGIDDLLLGAPGADSLDEQAVPIVDAGYVYAIHGGNANLDATATPGVIALSRVANGEADEVAGMVFIGTVAGGELGRSITGAADVNGDGTYDVLIAGDGEAYTISGDDPKTTTGSTRTGGGTPTTSQPLLRTLAGYDAIRDFAAVRYAASSSEPLTIGTAGDLNADGFDDFIIGSPQADRSDADDVGRAYIILGSPAPAETDVALSEVGTSVAGFAMEGAEEGDQLGASVGGGLDLNADGVDDGLVGAPNADSSLAAPVDAGETYVISPLQPGEVLNLTLQIVGGVTRLTFNAGDRASGYGVYRGVVGVLRTAGRVKTSDTVKLACGVAPNPDGTPPVIDDADPPPPVGAGFYYLVTGKNGHGEGPLGAGVGPRLNDAPCP
jgi:hypothetical protein